VEAFYLFSVDLEDVRFAMKDGRRYAERVPDTVHRYLEWLDRRGFRCTFFVVGDAAEAYPSLIRAIVEAGHEIGCHTYRHIPIEKQTRDEFKKDLESNIEALRKAGARDISGFRAPMFTLTEATSWVYAILKELGFVYSSSVLPAKNPFWSWPGFGPDPKKVDGIWELPMTVKKIGPFVIPPAGGVYFRALPKFLIMRTAKKHLRSGRPLLGYFHPYDIDTEQERFMHPDIDDSRFYNFLMYHNRKKVFARLEALVDKGFRIIPYGEYVGRLTA
jgi:polysaccharide deacetylase family protein (PEP-CTERM system associated)